MHRGSPTEGFVRQVIKTVETETSGEFQVRRPYRYMYDSDDGSLYFQYFNRAGAENLWYRVSENALRDLFRSEWQALVCFTNPADRIAYLIPIGGVRAQLKLVGWTRPDLEVNIDHAGRRWRELDWDIIGYLRSFPAPEGDGHQGAP